MNNRTTSKLRVTTAQHEQILDALACDIAMHPERLVPIDAKLIARLQPLVDGVEVDFEQSLPFELDDAGMP